MLGIGVGIGIFGFILVLGIIMDILGKEKCLVLLNKWWLQLGTIPSIISYIATIVLLGIFILLAVYYA